MEMGHGKTPVAYRDGHEDEVKESDHEGVVAGRLVLPHPPRERETAAAEVHHHEPGTERVRPMKVKGVLPVRGSDQPPDEQTGPSAQEVRGH